METFASQLEGVFPNEIENNIFEDEVKTDVDAGLGRLNFQPFDPDIHPERIRFGEVTDVLGKVNTLLSPYGLDESMASDRPQTIQKEIRPRLVQAHFQSVRSHHDQAVNELGSEH